MKEKLKKSLKLEKRTIRKLDVRSGLRGGRRVTEAVGCIPTIDTCPTSSRPTDNLNCVLSVKPGWC